MSVQAVLFDLDGVLIDSETIWDEVRHGLADEHGLSWPNDATTLMQGMNTREWAHYLASVVGVPGTDNDVAKEVLDRMAARYSHGLPLLPGAIETVTQLATQWPLGLASSSARRLIDVVLAQMGVADLFQVTISTEEVAKGKPSPLVYLEAARRLGVDPAQAVAVEDSSNGLRSAAAAGLIVIAIPNPAFPPADDALASATTRLNSLADLTPTLLRDLQTPTGT